MAKNWFTSQETGHFDRGRATSLVSSLRANFGLAVPEAASASFLAESDWARPIAASHPNRAKYLIQSCLVNFTGGVPAMASLVPLGLMWRDR